MGFEELILGSNAPDRILNLGDQRGVSRGGGVRVKKICVLENRAPVKSPLSMESLGLMVDTRMGVTSQDSPKLRSRS